MGFSTSRRTRGVQVFLQFICFIVSVFFIIKELFRNCIVLPQHSKQKPCLHTAHELFGLKLSMMALQRSYEVGITHQRGQGSIIMFSKYGDDSSRLRNSLNLL